MVSPEELRSNVVSFLATKPFAADGDHLENYVPVDWDVYLAGMADSTTYGNHLTLFAAAKLYDVQFVVISSIGNSGTRFVSADSTDELQLDQPILFLGHYAKTGESLKEHYISLKWTGASDLVEFIQSLHKKQDHPHFLCLLVQFCRPKRQQNVDQLLELQRDTLAAVNSLVAIQGEIREIKGAKLELLKLLPKL